jgi:hypothetical protein
MCKVLMCGYADVRMCRCTFAKATAHEVCGCGRGHGSKFMVDSRRVLFRTMGICGCEELGIFASTSIKFLIRIIICTFAELHVCTTSKNPRYGGYRFFRVRAGFTAGYKRKAYSLY